MGWIGEKIRIAAERVAATATDIAPTRSVSLHAAELRDLVAMGVPLERLAAALTLAGLASSRTGHGISGRILGRMLRAAPEKPAAVPPPSISTTTPVRDASAPAVASDRVVVSTTSRAGRGLESLAGKRRNQ
jgi:hypothetical protein